MIMRLLKRISLVGLSVVIAGSVVYVFAVLPAQQELREERVRSLAQRVDTFIKVRTASFWAVTSRLDPENLRTDAHVERSLVALREFCPDFLSLEVLDEQGEILAMLGDIPLSEAGRQGSSEDVKSLTAAQDSRREWFSDDPGSGSYYILTSHTERDGRKWFARGRFSRTQLELTLSSANQFGTAQLRNTASEAPSPHSSRISLAPLSYPGWSVLFEQRPWSARGSSKWEMGAVSVAFLAVIVLLFIRYGPAATRLVYPSAGGKPSLHREDERVTWPLYPEPAAETPGEEPEEELPSASATPDEGDDRVPEPTGIAYETVPFPWTEALAEDDAASFETDPLRAVLAEASDEEEPGLSSPRDLPGADEASDLMEIPETLEIRWTEPAASAQAGSR